MCCPGAMAKMPVENTREFERSPKVLSTHLGLADTAGLAQEVLL